MKKNIIYTTLFFLAATFVACDENEVMPAFETKGTATHTVATIAASKTTAAPGETITITMTYVNPSSDPVTQIVLKAKVGAADYVDVQTFNESSATKDKSEIRTVNYVMPASPTTVVFDMVITSGRDYPQVRRVTARVQ